jgi:hypothetical protein
VIRDEASGGIYFVWRARRALFFALAAVSVLIGMTGSLGALTALDAQATARDAMTHARAVEDELRNGDMLSPDTLQTAQRHLQAIAQDLQRLENNSLLSGPLVDSLGAGEIRHMLAMGASLVMAGQAGVDAALILVPHAGDLFHGLSGATDSSGATDNSGVTSPPLSGADVARIGDDLAAIDRLFRRALAERAFVRDDDLRRFGFASLAPQLRQLDDLAPQVTADLEYARQVVGALPALLGLTEPARYLLLNLDSDELRPTGGFIGNYGVLTVSAGRLQGGVQLHDIYTLDCPHGCPYRPVPAGYTWMDVAATQFGLRDANLDPDYPQSSRLIMDLFTQDGGPQVKGVISITPAFAAAIMQITGPILVPEYNRTVTAEDLEDVLHYYHLQGGGGLPGGVPGSAYGTSDRKVIDALLAKNLLAAVAKAPAAQQHALIRVALNALQTRDLQIYVDDTATQQTLANLGLAGEVYTPSGGDSLLIVDANVGVTYANADVTERLTQNVTLDAQGSATHDVTLTYTYAKRSHLYDSVFVAAGGGWYYRDFVRVIVPAGAQFTSGSGCAWALVAQAQRAAWGCLFILGASQTVTLHLRWTVPHVVTAGSHQGNQRYQLYLQRQAGNLVTVDTSLSLPANAQVAQPVAAPLVVAGEGKATYSAPLARSQQLTVDYEP